MTTLILQVPDSLETDHEETVRFLAAKLYESGKLSLRQAAEAAGMAKWDFAEILVIYNVNYFQYNSEDMTNEAKRIS